MLARKQTKTADAKGRVLLGEKFANRVVIIQTVDETEVRVTLARVIPDRETWLYENIDAKAMVFKGIEESFKKQFVPGPDWQKASLLANAIDDQAESLDANLQTKLDANRRAGISKTDGKRGTSQKRQSKTKK